MHAVLPVDSGLVHVACSVQWHMTGCDGCWDLLVLYTYQEKGQIQVEAFPYGLSSGKNEKIHRRVQQPNEVMSLRGVFFFFLVIISVSDSYHDSQIYPSHSQNYLMKGSDELDFEIFYQFKKEKMALII